MLAYLLRGGEYVTSIGKWERSYRHSLITTERSFLEPEIVLPVDWLFLYIRLCDDGKNIKLSKSIFGSETEVKAPLGCEKTIKNCQRKKWTKPQKHLDLHNAEILLSSSGHRFYCFLSFSFIFFGILRYLRQIKPSHCSHFILCKLQAQQSELSLSLHINCEKQASEWYHCVRVNYNLRRDEIEVLRIMTIIMLTDNGS